MNHQQNKAPGSVEALSNIRGKRIFWYMEEPDDLDTINIEDIRKWTGGPDFILNEPRIYKYDEDGMPELEEI